MKLPEIRIVYSWLLAGGPSKVLEKQFGPQKEWTDAEYEKWAHLYRNAWQKYESDILPAMQEVFGLEFYSPVIDVAVAPWFTAQSDPVILHFGYEPERFVDALAHELLHVLLTDNKTYSIKSSGQPVDLSQRWQKLFGEREFNELVHIPVHAGLKYIYMDVLHEPSRLEFDIEDNKDNPPYKAAWEYVQAHDYHEIINRIQDDFESIQREI